MKHLIILSILFFGTMHTMFASNYEQVMGETIQKMYTSQSADELTAVANQFERIATKETGQWLPSYYQAYSYVMILHQNSGLSNDEKDRFLDKAQAVLEPLKKNFDKESEVFVLQGLVYQMRIIEESRGYQYSMLSNEAFSIAEKLNPENPRALYLKGCNVFYTPEQFGGGAARAKPMLEKANLLFLSNKEVNPLLPNWGKEHCTYMLEQCASK